ncbi:Glutamine--fructose-6-phosphate aminotransferase [isomerizing] 2 [Asimina triloba]
MLTFKSSNSKWLKFIYCSFTHTTEIQYTRASRVWICVPRIRKQLFPPSSVFVFFFVLFFVSKPQRERQGGENSFEKSLLPVREKENVRDFRRERRYILEVLFNGLRRLEYRGYDSAGISIDADRSRLSTAVAGGCEGGSSCRSSPLLVFRQEGKIESLVKSVYEVSDGLALVENTGISGVLRLRKVRIFVQVGFFLHGKPEMEIALFLFPRSLTGGGRHYNPRSSLEGLLRRVCAIKPPEYELCTSGSNQVY